MRTIEVLDGTTLRTATIVRDGLAVIADTPARKRAKPNGATRTRKSMTAAQKKAVGKRMRAYWAKRRKASKRASK